MAGSDSTSREPPATASATQPISGTWPVAPATAATRASASPKKCSEANSTANEGEEPPSAARASLTARRAAATGSAASTRAPPAFTSPDYAPIAVTADRLCFSPPGSLTGPASLAGQIRLMIVNQDGAPLSS